MGPVIRLLTFSEMKNIIICLMLLCMVSCEQEYVNPEGAAYGVCGVSNPLEELPWLKAQIDEATQGEPTDYCRVVTVIQGSYNGELVFIPVQSGALCCTCGNAVYNCAGELVFACDQEKEAKIRDKRVIWQKKN